MGQGLDGDDLADRAVLDEPLGVDVPRVEAAHESYLELDRGALGGLDHVAALVFADRHGLLAQDVLARRRGVDGDLPVVLRRRPTPAFPGVRVGGQVPGEPDVGLTCPGGPRGKIGISAVAAHEQFGNGVGRRDAQLLTFKP